MTTIDRKSDGMIMQLARELLALKAAGVIANVWVDAGTVRVSWPNDPHTRCWLPNGRAWRLVAAHKQQVAA